MDVCWPSTFWLFVQPLFRAFEVDVREIFSNKAGASSAELRLRGITTIEAANLFLKKSYKREFSRKFARTAVEAEATAFLP